MPPPDTPIILGRYSPSQNGTVISPNGIAPCIAGGVKATTPTNPKSSSNMTNEQRKQLIRQHGSDICEFCERQFPYAGSCHAATCRCAEDAYFGHINKPHP